MCKHESSISKCVLDKSIVYRTFSTFERKYKCVDMTSSISYILIYTPFPQDPGHKIHIELSITISNIISSSVTANSNQPWSLNISPFLMKFEPAWMESSNHRRGSNELVIFIPGTPTEGTSYRNSSGMCGSS